MDKLKMHSPNLVDTNVEKIAALFPNCVTEAQDENGNLTKVVDFDLLRQELSNQLVEGDQERYRLDWPGKKEAILAANAPIAKTLRPCREESVNFDTTQNLFIEGDNLDALKLLQENYLGKVKMIYIDPPYNTGNDFIYEDDFAESTNEFFEKSNQVDEEGNRLIANTDSNGRFHSDWLSMMYSRLKLARALLANNGVVFIQIDDNEVENLGKLLYEVFGEDNFINLLTVKTKIGGVSGSSEGKSLKDATEFIWIFAKSKAELQFNPVYIKTKLSDRIKSYEAEGKSWKYTSVMTKLEGKVLIKDDTARGMKFYGYSSLETKSLSAFAREKGITEEEVYNLYADKIFRTTNAQSSVRQTVIRETRGYDYQMFGCEYVPIKGRNEGQTIEILYKSASGDQRNMMMFLSEVVQKIEGTYYYLDKVSSLWDDIDYNNLTKEGNVEFSNGKKPIKLLQRMLSLITNEDSLVIDFFAGSSSTAHAVMQQNAEDNGKRKFIMVQLPEATDEKSEANKAGYVTISEISKERIRRAGKQILAENKDRQGIEQLDIGFRVLKVDSTNMKEVYYTPDSVKQADILDQVSNIKEDRTAEDLLFQVMLDWGVELSLPIEQKIISSKQVYFVDGNTLIACFDEIDSTIVDAVAQAHPLRFVFAEKNVQHDHDKTNIKERFKLLSPETEVKVI